VLTQPLGSTGLTVTPIGLGLAALGRPAYITAGRDVDLGEDRTQTSMERRTHEVLDAAYQAGVRYLDAARSYGRAEDFLASWLKSRGVAPGALTVGSKWGYTYVGEWRLDTAVQEVKDHSVAALRRQLDESQAALGTYLSLYQIHSATLETGVLDNREVLAILADQRDRGLNIGLTVSGPQQGDVICRALEVELDGANPFQTVQATWNLLEPSAGTALAEAHRAGWGVIVKEAVANGRLAVRGARGDHSGLGRVARQHGVPADQVAMAAALSQPWNDVVLSGAVTVAELTSNVQAVSLTLTDADLDELGQLAQPAEEYWEERSRLPWR
jgi:aryl-alcohol dehydrogenase-like predicted oxidoreductase